MQSRLPSVSLATALIQGADLFLGDFKNVLLC